MSYTHFQVQQLRTRNVVTLLTSFVLYVGASSTAQLIGQLILMNTPQDETQMFTQPPLVANISLAGVVIPSLYFIYALIAVAVRELKARKLEKMAKTDSLCGCNCGDCNDHEHGEHGHDMAVSDEELAELESIVEKAMSKKPASKAGRKPGKRAAKK